MTLILPRLMSTFPSPSSSSPSPPSSLFSSPHSSPSLFLSKSCCSAKYCARLPSPPTKISSSFFSPPSPSFSATERLCTSNTCGPTGVASWLFADVCLFLLVSSAFEADVRWFNCVTCPCHFLRFPSVLFDTIPSGFCICSCLTLDRLNVSLRLTIWSSEFCGMSFFCKVFPIFFFCTDR